MREGPDLRGRGAALATWLLTLVVMSSLANGLPAASTRTLAPAPGLGPRIAPAPPAVARATRPGASVDDDETPDDLAFLDELELAFRRGGTHSALRELEEYLRDFPTSLRARVLAARVATRRGRVDEAYGHLDAVGQPDPGLQGALLLRMGRYEEALELGHGPRLAPMAALRLRVAALDGMGRRGEAVAAARAVTRDPDTSDLDGYGLRDLGWLLAFERRWELANQALVFADRELNGPANADGELVDPETLVLLGRVYQAARQTGGGGSDKTLSTLDAVLEVDPGHPDALSVLARAYQYGNNGRQSMAALEKALATDPSHPEALVLRGEALLLSRQPERALAEAEAALAGNPRQREALALKAAALAVTTRVDEAALARDAFAAAHPESAALAALVGRVLQSHYRFAESIPWLERALSIEPEDEEPLPVLAQSLAHVGREQEAVAALEEHLRRSPFPYPWRNNMLEVLRKLAEQTVDVRTESGFVLRLPPGERDVYGRLLEERLERARADMAARWGVDPEQDLLIEVFDEHADFSVRTVGFEGFLALGACFGPVTTLISPLSEMRRQFLWSQTAVHEYAHVVTLTLSNQRMPRWLSEGVSVLEEKKVHPSWHRALEREVLDARANGLVVPVTRMDELFQDGSTVMLGYYLGSLVCEVIEREYGFDALRGFVAAYADDLTTDQAVRRALGVAPAVLDRALLAFIDSEVAARARVRPRYEERGKDRMREQALSGDPDALLELAWAYHQLGRDVDMQAALERVVESEGESLRVQRLLAERDVAEGRPARGLLRLRAWAGGEVVDADGLVLLAKLLLAEGERDEALDQLRRARDLFPSDVSGSGALALLFELLGGDDARRGEWLDVQRQIVSHDSTALEPRLVLAREAEAQGDLERAVELMAEVVDIDPYVPSSRMTLAGWLVSLGRHGEAAEQWRLVLSTRSDQTPGQDVAALERLQAEARERLEEEDP